MPIAVVTSVLQVPVPGTLIVDTAPVKGQVYVGGVAAGVAPVTLPLDPGNYVVGFGDVQGYVKPKPQTVQIISGQTTTVYETYTSAPPVPPIGDLLPMAVVAGGALIFLVALFRR